MQHRIVAWMVCSLMFMSTSCSDMQKKPLPPLSARIPVRFSPSIHAVFNRFSSSSGDSSNGSLSTSTGPTLMNRINVWKYRVFGSSRSKISLSSTTGLKPVFLPQDVINAGSNSSISSSSGSSLCSSSFSTTSYSVQSSSALTLRSAAECIDVTPNQYGIGAIRRGAQFYTGSLSPTASPIYILERRFFWKTIRSHAKKANTLCPARLVALDNALACLSPQSPTLVPFSALVTGSRWLRVPCTLSCSSLSVANSPTPAPPATRPCPPTCPAPPRPSNPVLTPTPSPVPPAPPDSIPEPGPAPAHSPTFSPTPAHVPPTRTASVNGSSSSSGRNGGSQQSPALRVAAPIALFALSAVAVWQGYEFATDKEKRARWTRAVASARKNGAQKWNSVQKFFYLNYKQLEERMNDLADKLEDWADSLDERDAGKAS